jgi:hypothetical protein
VRDSVALIVTLLRVARRHHPAFGDRGADQG